MTKAIAIFRLVIFEQIATKVWGVLLCALLIAIVVAPVLAPVEIDPSLAAPATSQAIYSLLLLFCGVAVPFFSSEIGRQQVVRQNRAYWASVGVSDLSYYFALNAAMWARR